MSDSGREQTPSSSRLDLTQASDPSDGARMPTFGPYQLQELIGRGGMGEVYRAYDTARGRVVALKRLPMSMAADPTFQARFRAEATLAAKLHEPHIIPIHDFGEIDGQLYIDMRLVEGPDLAHLLREVGPLPAQRVVDIITQVATALDAAHRAGLVHRDIKPGNVLLVRSESDVPADFVYVADFGIARAIDGSNSGSLTSTGATVGSMDYVAPERFGTDHGDRRADIYALGCLLYEALTAQRPFPVEGLPAIINAHLNTPPPAPTAQRPGLPAGLDAVVARAMAKDPDDRYQSAGALAADARRALDGATITAHSNGTDAWAIPDVSTTEPVTDDATAADAAEHAAPSQPSDTAPTDIVHAPDAATPRPAPPTPRLKRRRDLAILASIATVLVLAAAGITTQLIKPADSGGGEVFLESTGNPGQDPFSGTVVVGNPPQTRSQTPIGATGSGISTVAGDVPALYGGSRNEHVCDRQKLITFLQQNPDKAAAWAGVLNISVADIPTYIGTLTPMQLRADTRVTNHGFVDGHATSLQSVLQAGTAVLVDDQGRPRVKCGCGNPLLDPVATPITPSYTGEAWPDFNPRNVSAVTQAKARVDVFIVYDIRIDQTFSRPRGTDGDQDQPTPPSPAPTTAPAPTTTAPLAPTVVSCRRGTHLDGSVCVADAPVRCPDGQALEGGHCVATHESCPDGTHASDDGQSCDPDPPDCAIGAHRNSNGTMIYGSDCNGNCPEGTYQKSAICVTDTIPTCDPGYHVSYTNKCIKDCPDGYRQGARDGCAPITPTCPDGSTKTTAETCPATTGRRPPGRLRKRSFDTPPLRGGRKRNRMRASGRCRAL